uniref:Uncharacterized protein n=1 Tax=Romanomermis culicivorax TaxID=13658 RepID=A0A915I4T8_ROMCU
MDNSLRFPIELAHNKLKQSSYTKTSNSFVPKSRTLSLVKVAMLDGKALIKLSRNSRTCRLIRRPTSEGNSISDKSLSPRGY